jgi:hypothetical protein
LEAFSGDVTVVELVSDVMRRLTSFRGSMARVKELSELGVVQACGEARKFCKL